MYDDRLEVYERQIDCLRRGDRAEQLKLYAADLIYMFPFALDRPRKIVGLAQFRKVMEPLWRQAKAHGLKVTGYRGEVHLASDDPQLVFAEFALTVEKLAETSEIEFVQKLRIREGKIAVVAEYFSPHTRASFGDAGAAVPGRGLKIRRAGTTAHEPNNREAHPHRPSRPSNGRIVPRTRIVNAVPASGSGIIQQ